MVGGALSLRAAGLSAPPVARPGSAPYHRPVPKAGPHPFHAPATCRAVLAIALCALLAVGCEDASQPTLSLYRAVQVGNLDQIKRHIRAGTDLNQSDAKGDSPLHVAARAGQVSTVRELTDHGARLDALDRDGRTPLDLALIHGKTQAAAALIRAGAPLDPQTALTGLVEAGVSDRDSYDFLLRRGADISRPDAQGRAPLHLAVAHGHLETLRRLLARGARVNQPDGAGRTPLDLALDRADPGAGVKRTTADIVTTLEQNGARRGPASNLKGKIQ